VQLTNSRSSSFWTEAARRAPVSPAAPAEPAAPADEPQGRKSIRRDAPPTPAALIPTDDLLRLRLAEELEYARRMIELMGDELCSDGGVVVRHGMALQAVDIVGQMMGHIANVIRSSDPAGAIELIGMGELKARLKRQRIG
jgi:hypothetical protein